MFAHESSESAIFSQVGSGNFLEKGKRKKEKEREKRRKKKKRKKKRKMTGTSNCAREECNVWPLVSHVFALVLHSQGSCYSATKRTDHTNEVSDYTFIQQQY